MDPHIFSIEEATRTLEQQIKPALERLYTDIEALETQRRRGKILRLIVDSGAGCGSADRVAHARSLDSIAALRASVRDQITCIQDTGAEFRDVRHGLIDFHAERDGEVVCLCWQRGEQGIRFWHPLDTGFAGRRPIRQRANELDDL